MPERRQLVIGIVYDDPRPSSTSLAGDFPPVFDEIQIFSVPDGKDPLEWLKSLVEPKPNGQHVWCFAGPLDDENLDRGSVFYVEKLGIVVRGEFSENALSDSEQQRIALIKDNLQSWLRQDAQREFFPSTPPPSWGNS